MPIITIPFMFHELSGYTDAPFKEMGYGAKSFMTLNSTKGYRHRVKALEAVRTQLGRERQ